MMRVIINADDFGLSPGINRGVIRAFEQGLVRSASLSVLGRGFLEAAAYCRENPGLDAGLHLTLTDEKPLTDARALFPGAWDSDFLPGMGTLFRLVVSGRADLAAIEGELKAQMERAADAGLSISHLDGHQHVHLFLKLFPLCLDLCKRRGIRHMRTRLTDRMALRAGPGRIAQYLGLRLFLGAAVQTRIPRELPIIPCTGFLLSGGRLRVRDLLANLRALRRFPVVEVILHPGEAGDCERERYGHWDYAWEADRDLACSPELRQGLADMGARVTCFRELG